LWQDGEAHDLRAIARRGSDAVDLPAPERPMTPTMWPCGISKETSSTAMVVPKGLVSLAMRSISAFL